MKFKERMPEPAQTFTNEQEWLDAVEEAQLEVEAAQAKKIAAKGPAEYGPAIRNLDAKEKELAGLMFGRVLITSPSKGTLEKALEKAEQRLMQSKDEASYHRAVGEIESYRLRLSELND